MMPLLRNGGVGSHRMAAHLALLPTRDSSGMECSFCSSLYFSL